MTTTQTTTQTIARTADCTCSYVGGRHWVTDVSCPADHGAVTDAVRRRAHQIEAIACQILDCHMTAVEAAVANAEGWTVDIRYGHEGPGNWTRTEGIVLTADELAEAIALPDRPGWGY